MGKITYFNLINGLINESNIKVLGKIQVEVLNSQKFESLYYTFPLIERLVLEIYKLIPSSNVEHYDQGTMKTLNSIIDNNDENIISEDLKEKVKKYFDDDGIRNKILHVKDNDTVSIEVNFNELAYIIMCLLSIFNRMYNQYSFSNIHKIEHLPI